MIARAVDMVTVLFVTLSAVLLGLATVMDTLSDRVTPDPWGRAFCATILYATVATIYEVAFLVATGQTPGKDLFNLRVVDASTGAPPRWTAAIRRTIPFTAIRLVPGVVEGTAAVLLLGVNVPFDTRRRGLHDRLAHTVVIRYDADAEEVDQPQVDRDDLWTRYGPRSIWDHVTRSHRRR